MHTVRSFFVCFLETELWDAYRSHQFTSRLVISVQLWVAPPYHIWVHGTKPTSGGSWSVKFFNGPCLRKHNQRDTSAVDLSQDFSDPESFGISNNNHIPLSTSRSSACSLIFLKFIIFAYFHGIVCMFRFRCTRTVQRFQTVTLWALNGRTWYRRPRRWKVLKTSRWAV